MSHHTNDPVQGLDGPCSVCARVAGDHTLREWARCLGATTSDLPYEPVPEDAARVAAEHMRTRFGMPDDWIVADNVIAKALVLDVHAGTVVLKLPIVLHEFAVATPTGIVDIAKVAFIGHDDSMRKYGQLIKDAANGAANAAQRTQGATK